MALETLKEVKEIGGFELHRNSWKSDGTSAALLWSMKRKLDREKRGVEGLNKK